MLLVILLVVALVALDILALEFGADSRILRDPSGRSWPDF